MGILMWEKPLAVMTRQEREGYVADGAPPGCYTPNMSREDVGRWKAKVVGQKTGFLQVEIRKDSTVVVLSLNGYKYKHYDLRRTPENLKKWKKQNEDPTCVHIASAGPMQLSLSELTEFMSAIEEGMQFLRRAAVQKDQP